MSQAVMRRKDRETSRSEVESLLQQATRANFATVGPDGQPYVVPNLFVYAEDKIYLHTANAAGHFRSNVEHSERISFAVTEAGQIFPYGEFECDTSASYLSVIGFGTLGIVADEAEKARFFDRRLAKYGDPAWNRPKGFYPRLPDVTVYCIEPERTTGKKGPLLRPGEQWPARNQTKSPGAVPPRSE